VSSQFTLLDLTQLTLTGLRDQALVVGTSLTYLCMGTTQQDKDQTKDLLKLTYNTVH